jgi:hypothetical protein
MTPPGTSISWKISSSLYIGVEASLSPVLMVLGGKTGLIWLIATRLDVGTQSIGGSINPVTPLKSRLDFHTSHSYSVVLMAPSYGPYMAKDLNVRHDAAVQWLHGSYDSGCTHGVHVGFVLVGRCQLNRSRVQI